MAIKTIIFDIGGVIAATDFDAIYADFGKRIGLTAEIISDYHKQNFDQMILGHISLDDFWNDMKKLGAHKNIDYQNIWIEVSRSHRETNKNLLEIIHELRKTYSIGALTNLTPHRILIDNDLDLYSSFDYKILSCVEHLKKPDPLFYKLALSRAGVMPEEAIFIDDQEKCTRAAEKINIKSIIYSYPNNEKFIDELKKLDVNVDSGK